MVSGWQVAAKVEREELRKAGPNSTAAIQGAFELMDLFDELHGWPPPENEGRRRDDELARECWTRVRAFHRAHGQTAEPKTP